MTLPTSLDNCPVKTDGSAKGYHVIATACGLAMTVKIPIGCNQFALY